MYTQTHTHTWYKILGLLWKEVDLSKFIAQLGQWLECTIGWNQEMDSSTDFFPEFVISSSEIA